MKKYIVFLLLVSSVSLSSCSLQEPKNQSLTINHAWYYDILKKSCNTGTWDISTCQQMIVYAQQKKLKKADNWVCPDMMAITSTPYNTVEVDWCDIDPMILSENTKNYNNGFRLVQTNLQSDVYYREKLIYTFDHDAVLKASWSVLKDYIFFNPMCRYLDHTKKDTTWKMQDPATYLSPDQVWGCVRSYIIYALSPYSFSDSLLQISLWSHGPIVIVDLRKGEKYAIDDDYAGSEYRQSSKYNFLIWATGLTIFDKTWNKIWGLYFETDFNPSMTIITGTGGDTNLNDYLFAKFQRLDEKPDGNIDVIFKNAKWEEVIQKIVLNGNFPPYKQRTKVITQESEIGKWVQAKDLVAWEQDERVSLPISLCDTSWNCTDGNPPDKNSLEKFVTSFPNIGNIAYFRDKNAYYSLFVGKNGDRWSFRILKNKSDLIVVDGYVFEYDSKNTLAFAWIPLSEKEYIQIRDGFLMDSKNIWPTDIWFTTFDQVKWADPKTFRPLTNIHRDWWEWKYMIDKNNCYWFGWDRVNDSGIVYSIIPRCNPSKLKYLGWVYATDGNSTFSWWILTSTWVLEKSLH